MHLSMKVNVVSQIAHFHVFTLMYCIMVGGGKAALLSEHTELHETVRRERKVSPVRSILVVWSLFFFVPHRALLCCAVHLPCLPLNF